MQDSDFRWFIENYDNLYKRYGVSYLAIKDSTVLGSYKSYEEAVRKTQEEICLGDFIVQHCDGFVSGYTTYITAVF